MSQLHYERFGSGPRLLYCNGSGTTLRAVRPMLHTWADHFEVLAFDYRGMGASPPAEELYTMADLAGDVADLLDTVGWEKTAMAGMSFGGMVAQEFAVTFPERVERLALLATSPGGAFASYPLDQLADLPVAERIGKSLLLADRRWTGDWLAARPGEAAVASGFAASHVGGKDVGGKDVGGKTEAGPKLQLQARKGHDVLSRLHRVSCPTLVGSGRYDDIAPVVNGRAIADRIPGAVLRVYGGGHLFLMQDPAAWPDVTEFLAR